MNRRKFITNAGVALAGATSLKGLALPRNLLLSSTSFPGRMIVPLNRDWRFSQHMPDGFERPEFNDSKFDSICLPHTNLQLPWHSFDEKSYQFVSAYRRRFHLPPESQGKCVFVDFEGAMTAATVWINGQKLGEYKGGYTPFLSI